MRTTSLTKRFQVGNQAFADYMDANIDVTHINNRVRSRLRLLPICSHRLGTCRKTSFPLYPESSLDSTIRRGRSISKIQAIGTLARASGMAPWSALTRLTSRIRLGQDNESKLCTTGDVPTVLQGNAVSHVLRVIHGKPDAYSSRAIMKPPITTL